MKFWDFHKELRKYAGAFVVYRNKIRSVDGKFGPITFLANQKRGMNIFNNRDYQNAARYLGLSIDVMHVIARASDYKMYDLDRVGYWHRVRLLSSLGLKETK